MLPTFAVQLYSHFIDKKNVQVIVPQVVPCEKQSISVTSVQPLQPITTLLSKSSLLLQKVAIDCHRHHPLLVTNQ